ncbi:hypothetical protein P389DRAFT_110525 [Cystobasidium minutum MCA 4210]|uniref:uncharacterized protein n=1 Tax=Cystobasidium minutum MCA 4210 TaxID=1397322 RepID=UPI0034CD6743|eukprot:jgi/Rhomi1/110525/CE110524_16197
MASGFSYSGGRSRCHPFWAEFAKCYANADKPEDCTLQRDDYMECLHHTKEIKRAQTIKSHYLESERKRLAQKKQEAEEKAAVPGGIMGLNLIGYNDDSSDNGNGGSQGVKQPTQDSKAGEKAPKEGVKQAS